MELHAYGDSRGDRELLQRATEPHWRSFQAAARSYPSGPWLSRWFTPLAAVMLLSALAGLWQLDPTTQSNLISGLIRLLSWLPAILAVLVVSYAGRFWRFRLMLNAEGIGRCSRHEAWVWFQGFALTATPGKLGELSRVQQLHQQLGYPRSPLLHAFLAERLCDAVAVLIWLALLVPGQLLQRLGPLDATAVAIFSLAALLALPLGSWLWVRCSHWRQHLPSRNLARACLPASGVSLGVWGLEAMILWLLVQAISPATTVNPGQAISIYLLSGTAGMASLLPGGLGVNEATTTIMLQQAGISTSLALTIAVLRRVVTIWFVVFLSCIFSLIPFGGLNAER